MPTAPLNPITLLAPGNKGLNTEDAGFLSDPSWSLVLDNGVIDNAGRVAARKGWTGLYSSGTAPVGDVLSVGEYIIDADNTKVIYSTATQVLHGPEATTVITKSGGTGGRFQFLNFNGSMIAVLAGQVPQYWSNTGLFADVSGGAGTAPQGGTGLSAFGRLWITDADEQTIKFCALLNENEWGGASAGSLDTLEVWPDGADVITGLAELQGKLVIFGRRSVLIYDGATDPTGSGFVLADTIQHGCVDPATIQRVGNDLVYLAPDGLRSLQRGLEFSNLPLTSLSDTVRSELVDDIAQIASNTYASFYSEAEGLYGLKVGLRYWAFNVRQIDNGDLRASRWFGIGYTCAFAAVDGTIYLGQSTQLGSYSGYLDDASTYTLRWRSVWLAPSENRLFLPKRAKLTLVTQASYVVTLRWAQDYINDFKAEQQALPVTKLSEWSGDPLQLPSPEAEWSGDPDQVPATLAEWSGGGSFVKVLGYDLTEEGERWSLELSVEINGNSFAIQKIDLFGKLGRLAA